MNLDNIAFNPKLYIKKRILLIYQFHSNFAEVYFVFNYKENLLFVFVSKLIGRMTSRTANRITLWRQRKVTRTSMSDQKVKNFCDTVLLVL